MKKKRPTSGAINRALDTRSRPGPFASKGGVMGKRTNFPGKMSGGTSDHASYPMGHGVNTPAARSLGALMVGGQRMPIATKLPKLPV